MASLLREKVTGGGDTKDAKKEAEKYRLRVTAGPSYDLSTHKDVLVNTPSATYVENDSIRAKVNVRIRGFCGLPSTCPESSPYFDHPMHAKDQYSVAFSFVPKRDLASTDLVWGNDFDHPVRDRLPPGFNMAFRIVKDLVDPGLSCDAYADEPWLYGPALSCWFALRVGPVVGDDEDFPAPGGGGDDREGTDHPDAGVVIEGADGDDAQALRDSAGLPSNNEKRRKFFLDAANRDRFTFQKNRLYHVDFYNPFLDFGKFALKLPGFSLGVLKYIDGKTHYLRYVFKNPKTNELLLNVNMTLLFGQQLQEALQKERQALGDAATEERATGSASDRAEAEDDDDDEENKDEQSERKQSHGSDSDVRLEPDANAVKIRQRTGMDEITHLLEDTATGDRRGTKTDVLDQ